MVSDSVWTPLLPAAALSVGSRRFVAVQGHELAVFHLDEPDRFIVIANSCPHAGGNLSAGEVRGNSVICPWHEWAFDLDTSLCTESERVCVRKYDTRVREGMVEVRLGSDR